MKNKKHTGILIEYDPNTCLWCRKIKQEIIVYFAKKAIKIEEGNINLLVVQRRARGKRGNILLANAWVYPDKHIRHFLRIEIKAKKLGPGLNFKTKSTIKKIITRRSALKEYRDSLFCFIKRKKDWINELFNSH